MLESQPGQQQLLILLLLLLLLDVLLFLHRESEKQDTKLLAIASPTII